MQKIFLIIPCYNEEVRFPKDQFLNFYQSSTLFSFCFVNDGSKDQTCNMLDQLRKGREERIQIVNLQRNQGKAEAIRQGMVEVLKNFPSANLIGYVDADFATPLEEMEKMAIEIGKNNQCQMIFGSRVKLLGRKIKRKLLRHYFGRVFSTIASIILRLPVYDTQCGAKIFKRDLASKVFSESFLTKWLFDVELFARIVRLYGIQETKASLVEYPLNQWIEMGDSRLKIVDLIKTPINLMRIFFHYK